MDELVAQFSEAAIKNAAIERGYDPETCVYLWLDMQEMDEEDEADTQDIVDTVLELFGEWPMHQSIPDLASGFLRHLGLMESFDG